jgi:hypothetical protein
MSFPETPTATVVSRSLDDVPQRQAMVVYILVPAAFLLDGHLTTSPSFTAGQNFGAARTEL